MLRSILIVDDEAAVRGLVTRVVRGGGPARRSDRLRAEAIGFVPKRELVGPVLRRLIGGGSDGGD